MFHIHCFSCTKVLKSEHLRQNCKSCQSVHIEVLQRAKNQKWNPNGNTTYQALLTNQVPKRDIENMHWRNI